MKRILHLLTALLLLASPSLANAYDFEVDGIYYNITSTTDLTVEVTYKSTSYNSYSGDVTIPETVTCDGTAYAVTSIGTYAFYGCTALTSVTIPDAVTSIGNYAFRGCSQLTSLALPVSASYTTYYGSSAKCPFDHSILTDLTLTGKGDMMNFAFYKATALKSVTLSDGITSIGDFAFYNCSSLTSVTIPDAVESIGTSAFYGCSGLTSVSIGDAVTSIGLSAFYGCTGLTSITIPDGVTSIGNVAFRGCTQLTSLSLPVSASYTTYYSSSGYCPFDFTILTDLTLTGKGDRWTMRSIKPRH